MQFDSLDLPREAGRFPYADRIEAALKGGTVEQRLDKIALYLALAGPSFSDVVAADLAERVEREVMFERPGHDPRA